MSMHPNPFLRACKAVVNAAALGIAAIPAATCWVEKRLNQDGEGLFGFWSHVYAVLPGHPGQFLRRAYYVLTLDQCSLDSSIGFGVVFAHREARIEDNVTIGPYTVIGCATIHEGSLVGTRASLMSGSSQHQMDQDGCWVAPHSDHFELIEIGPYAWIGEAAIVMANVGERSIVAAGAVVSSAVPPHVTVAGNPARFVRGHRPNPAVASRPVSPDSVGV